MVKRSPTPLAAGGELARFACSAPARNLSPPPRPVELAEAAGQEAELEAAGGRPDRVRDPAAVGMIRLAGPAAATPAAEIPTLDEYSGMR